MLLLYGTVQTVQKKEINKCLWWQKYLNAKLTKRWSLLNNNYCSLVFMIIYIIIIISYWSKLLIFHACWCFSDDTSNALEIHRQNGQSYFWFNQLGRESLICSTLIKHMGSSSKKKLKLLSIKAKDRLTTNLAWAKLKEPSLLASSLCSVSLKCVHSVYISGVIESWCCGKAELLTSGQGQRMTAPREDSIITWTKQVSKLS